MILLLSDAWICSFIHSFIFFQSCFLDIDTYLRMVPTRCSKSSISLFVISYIAIFVFRAMDSPRKKDSVLICFDYGACQRYYITTMLQYFSDLHVFIYVHVHVPGMRTPALAYDSL